MLVAANGLVVRTLAGFDVMVVIMPQLPCPMTLPYCDDADTGSDEAKSDVSNDLGLIRIHA